MNALIAANSTEVTGPPQRLDPAKGNVCFASAQHGWAFTTTSFAKVKLTATNPHDQEGRAFLDGVGFWALVSVLELVFYFIFYDMTWHSMT